MSETSQTPRCPHCSAEWPAGSDQRKCWLCGKTVDHRVTAKDATRKAAPPIQFGVDSILLLTTFVAVICGVFAVVPGVGVAIAILGLPALIRTAILARRGRVAGEPLGWGAKSLTFLATLSFVVVLIAATGAAFYATCWVGFWAGAVGHEAVDSGAGYEVLATGFLVGVPLGIVAALAVMWWMIRRAVKTNYRVPAWTSWAGFGVSLLALVVFLFMHRHDVALFFLCFSALGLVFSLLGLGTPRRWNTAWGVGLGAGPLLICLLVLLVDSDFSSLKSIAVPIASIVVGLVIAAPLHWWVMTLDEVDT